MMQALRKEFFDNIKLQQEFAPREKEKVMASLVNKKEKKKPKKEKK